MPSTTGLWLHRAQNTEETVPDELPIWIPLDWWHATNIAPSSVLNIYVNINKPSNQCLSSKSEWHLVVIMDSERSAPTSSLHHSCDQHILLKDASPWSVVVTHNKAHLQQELRSTEVLQLRQSKAELNQAIWILRKLANVPQVPIFFLLCRTGVTEVKSQIFLANKTPARAYCNFAIFMLQNFCPAMAAVDI